MVGDAEDLCISTFHSFCNQVILDNILNTKLNANFKVITPLKVGDWFSRSNEQMFLNPKTKPSTQYKLRSQTLRQKSKQQNLNPKKEAGNATTATTPASATYKLVNKVCFWVFLWMPNFDSLL